MRDTSLRSRKLRTRYREWEIIGPPEIRGDAPVQMFQPTPSRTPSDDAENCSELAPVIDATERYLLQLFLRRYVTWCARRRRFAQMQGARRDYAAMSAPHSGRSFYRFRPRCCLSARLEADNRPPPQGTKRSSSGRITTLSCAVGSLRTPTKTAGVVVLRFTATCGTFAGMKR